MSHYSIVEPKLAVVSVSCLLITGPAPAPQRCSTVQVRELVDSLSQMVAGILSFSQNVVRGSHFLIWVWISGWDFTVRMRWW